MNKNRITALLLSIVMLLGVMPSNVFAEDGLEMEPAKSPVAVANAAEPEKSDTDADANNAVHGYVGLTQGVNIDQDMSAVTGDQFTPKAGIDVYFQWYEGLNGPNQYTSPVYKATSGSDGQFHMAVNPYIAPDGKLIKFDADTTISAGNERYKFWVDEKTIPEGYALQYITGEGVVFPDKGLPITQGGSGSNVARNIHGNWKVLLRELPKADMHKKEKNTSIQQSGGFIFGKVSWDYESRIGGITYHDVANHTVPAPDVTIRASYLSDYAMKKIYSNDTAIYMGVSKPEDIRGSGWTVGQENKLQEWIRNQAIAEPDNWIAETVTAKTNAKGEYILQFNGIWGKYKNADAALKTYKYKVGDYVSPGNRWTQEQVDRLGSVAADAADGDFVLTTAAANKAKHINYDWLFVSADDTDHLRVMTPYSKNQYMSMNSAWGIHAGWSGNDFGVGVDLAPRAKLKADFAMAPVSIDFNITNYDSGVNTAIPGDVAETLTEGLPYSHTSDSYRIVWYDENGKVVKTGIAQKPDETGKLNSEPFDTSSVKETTNYTAKLYRLDSKGNNKDLLGQDSFSVQISKIIVSAYDDVKIPNPAYGKKGMEGAKFYSDNLPKGLSINENTGEITGKASQPGKHIVTIKTIVPDKDLGDIEGTKDYTALVTDSPLAKGEVGKAYSQKVVPEPKEGYIYKNMTVAFAEEAIAGLSIEGDTISGTPTTKVEATEEDPNVEVTYNIYKLNDKGE